MSMTHTPPPAELDFKTALHEEHHLLETADVPMVTVSATTREQLTAEFHESFPDTPEVVFSRAHYSMALSIVIEAYREGLNPYLVDPTNYVTRDDWSKVVMTQTVGRLVARHEVLKDIKNVAENFTRSKLPISPVIEKPLLYLFENVEKPILSLHYEAGNKLAKAGKRVVQVVTDPHIRPQYLDPLPNDNITYCVFDEDTKTELLAKTEELNKPFSSARVIVTGPPVDPRIIARRSSRPLVNSSTRPLQIAITTGGIGSNKTEIETILHQLTSNDFSSGQIQLLLNAGTNTDFDALYRNFAHSRGIPIGDLDNDTAPIRIISATGIAQVNEAIINYLFPWADVLVTKPSGDMAYDAAAAAIPCLFLDPLGPWEENIQSRFLALDIAHDLDVSHFMAEISTLNHPQTGTETWIAQAARRCLDLPPLYTHGTANILQAYRRQTKP